MTARHSLRACVPCAAPRCALPWCEFCRREPATLYNEAGDGFACEECAHQRDGDFGPEAGVNWRAVRS